MTAELENNVPLDLKNLQLWFGSVIGRKLTKEDRIDPTAPNGKSIVKEAANYIVASPTLEPHQRIQIYNQQYWWRVQSTLQTNFPLVTRLFGIASFNHSIAIPFFVKYPPNHWSLFQLGIRLPDWISEFYKKIDKNLVFNAAQLDNFFAISFVAPKKPSLNFEALSQGDTEELLETPFCLQPYLFLADYPYDLLNFRDSMMAQSEDYWIDQPFPELKSDKHYYYVIFRNHRNNISWMEVGKNEYKILRQFQDGISIQSACDWIETQEKSVQDDMEEHLQTWIQDWTKRAWLTLK